MMYMCITVILVTESEKKFLQGAAKIGLRIQDRFKAEPLYSKTGQSYMKSEGTSIQERIKSNFNNSKPKSR